MSGKRVSMRKIKECLRLKFTCNLSHERIALALGLSKGVVSKYVQMFRLSGLDWEALSILDEVEIEARLLPSSRRMPGKRACPDMALVHKELRRKSVTLQLLWEEYLVANMDSATYRYTQFCHLYNEYAASLKRSMRQIHRAGEKMFIDYAGQTIPIIDAGSGEISKAHIFVAVLGASNYTYACATTAETRSDWIGGLIQALNFFQGVPALVIPDNPKALITHPDRYEPGISQSAQECARHYGCAILPARPRHPQDKAKVEVGVQIVERWILARLRNRRFFSLTELNHAMSELLTELNRRPFKKLRGNRLEWYESIDRPALQPLPALAYEIATFKRCRVNIDYHVEIDGHYYSVPHSLVRQELDARFTQTTVEFLLRGRRVACHPRSTRRGGFTTLSEHMPAAHRAHLEWTPQRLIDWGSDIGPSTHRIVKHQLESKPHPEQGYRACLGLLSLARDYGRERLEKACTRAVAIKSLTRRTVLNILQTGMEAKPLPAEARQTDWITPEHDNVRGPAYYH
ncbi:MAG: IS21 family transposase [Burkholderiales bacterium]|nr:MAG: IS21 family transposase [Burkholderiales bacterium 21-58-4]